MLRERARCCNQQSMNCVSICCMRQPEKSAHSWRGGSEDVRPFDLASSRTSAPKCGAAERAIVADIDARYGLALDQDGHAGVIAVCNRSAPKTWLTCAVGSARARSQLQLGLTERHAFVSVSVRPEWLMLAKPLEQDHRQQAQTSRAAGDHKERCGRLADLLAITAGELLANVLNHLRRPHSTRDSITPTSIRPSGWQSNPENPNLSIRKICSDNPGPPQICTQGRPWGSGGWVGPHFCSRSRENSLLFDTKSSLMKKAFIPFV